MIKINGILGLTAVFLLGIAAYMFTAGGIIDEVYYLEPGVNLHLGKGFVSGFTQGINPDQTWGCSNPAMPGIYFAWFELVGFGFFQSRILSLAIHLLGCLLILRWVALRLGATKLTLCIVAAALVAPRTMAFVVVTCRPDVFAALIFGWFLHVAYPPEENRNPWLSAGALGAFMCLVALHYVGFFALAFAVLFLCHRERRFFYRGLATAIGVLSGLGATYLIYRHIGAWDSFIASRLWHYEGHEMPWVPTGLRMYVMNPEATATAMIAAAILARRSFKDGFLAASRTSSARALLASLGIFMLIPPVINLIGIYYNIYGWMVWVPMVLLLAPHLAVWLESLRPGRVAAMCCLTAIAYVAATCQLLGKNLERDRQMTAAASCLRRHVGVQEKVAIGPWAYYKVKPSHPRVYVAYSSSSFWPAEVRNSITCVLNDRFNAEKATDSLGGKWVEIHDSQMPGNWVLLRRELPVR